MIKVIFVAAGTAMLSACVTAPPGQEPPARAANDSCEAEPGQRFVGSKATPETGAAILEATGSRHLRWVPPDTAVTLEYRFERVTVSYDRNYTILQVTCG